MPRRLLLSFLPALALLAHAPVARAETPPACRAVDRGNVVACALKGSALLRVERENQAAAEGRRTSAAPWFPAQPTLSLSAGRRVSSGSGGGDAVNWYGTLSQEVAISGERASRRRAAEADVAARGHEAKGTSRRVAAEAHAALYDVLAARDAVSVARLLETTAVSIRRVTRARADSGVGSPLDAEVAEAASLGIVQSRIAAERTAATATARLATLLGLDPIAEAPTASGELEPLPEGDALADAATTRSAAGRPEVQALLADERAAALRAEAFRRARVPSLTLQVFAQNDGFNERVLGGGVQLPIPLPEPVGRRFAGEIAEAEALGRANAARAEVVARELANDLATAAVDYRARRAELALYSRERVARAEQLLGEIGREIEAGRLPVRDALVAQQQLIEVLRGFVEARRALCLASVELALAGGAPLERTTR